MRLHRSRPILLAVCLLAGCGGTGSVATTYAGAFQGDWESPSTGDHGTINLLVHPNGDISGILHDEGNNLDGTVTGRINNAGQVSLRFTFVGEDATTITGSLRFDGQDHLVGDLTQRFSNGTTVRISFDLART